MLAWVCQRWRQVVFISPLGLNIRLHCVPGTPVLKTLDIWPALPIIMEYGGFPNLDPPTREDDDNIIAAMKQSSRVSSISLTVTSSLFEKLPVISEPFSVLEELALLSQDTVDSNLTVPSTFRWGPRLRTLHLTGIAFLSFPQLLLPSQDLIDLQLHEIPGAGYFSPEEFANALSGMTQLRSLSFHLLSFPRRRSFLTLPPSPGERILLPALTRLKYRGISKYLDSLAARIDAPRLGDIEITFFNQPTMDASQFSRFIERTEMQTSLIRADIETSAHAISISFSNSSTSTPLRLQISCKQLDWQLSSMTQICNHFSLFLFRVGDLLISSTQSSNGGGVATEQWLELIRAFSSARDFRVAGAHVADIFCALRTVDGVHTTDTTVLPALRNLHLQSMPVDESLWDIVQPFITSRRLSCHPAERHGECHICVIPDSTRFTRYRLQHELKRHLVNDHAYRIVCSYCDHFECVSGRKHLFLGHLRRKHPEFVRKGAPISGPLPPHSRPFQSINLLYQHGYSRAPDIAEHFTRSWYRAPHD